METGHNLLKVNIYYQQLNVMTITESAEYGVSEQSEEKYSLEFLKIIKIKPLSCKKCYSVSFLFRFSIYVRQLEVHYLFISGFLWPCFSRSLSLSLTSLSASFDAPRINDDEYYQELDKVRDWTKIKFNLIKTKKNF